MPRAKSNPQQDPTLPLPPPSVRRLQLWAHPMAMAILVTLLGAFWIWRKVTGLI